MNKDKESDENKVNFEQVHEFLGLNFLHFYLTSVKVVFEVKVILVIQRKVKMVCIVPIG